MRYRFADRILEIDAHGAGVLSAAKSFPRTDEFFDGTFRRENEVPSSLVLECMASAGSFLLTVKSRYRTHALLLKVNRAAFARPVLAGDRMIVRSRVVGTQGDWSGPEARPDASGVAEVHARCRVEGREVADAALLFLCVPLSRTLGARAEEIVNGMLELLGFGETRP
jgi:3-hydroxymyristoyl/3-hydroxydecanoyl-(acyl carrier protein) dehydratase